MAVVSALASAAALSAGSFATLVGGPAVPLLPLGHANHVPHPGPPHRPPPPPPSTTTTTTTLPPTTTTTTIASSGPSDPSGQAPPSATAYPGYTQALVDDFNGSSLNQTTWNGFYQAPTHVDGPWLASHGSVAGGMITMSEYQDPALNNEWVGTGLCTRSSWTSGMAFVRARADVGARVSVVFGLIGVSTWPPEIDFYEDMPTTNTRQYFTATTHYGPNDSMVVKANSTVDATQWHTYGVAWNSSTITYYVDGTAWATIPNPEPSGTHALDLPQKLFMQIETYDDNLPTSATPKVVNLNVDWVAVYTPA